MNTDGGGWRRNEINRQDAKVAEEGLPRPHTALTGRCRSGGLADTLIREFIRVSGCQPILVRIADSATCHASPINFLFCHLGVLGGSTQSVSIRVHPWFLSFSYFFLVVLGALAVQSHLWFVVGTAY
jgi:hypothetical protein